MVKLYACFCMPRQVIGLYILFIDIFILFSSVRAVMKYGSIGQADQATLSTQLANMRSEF